MDTTTTFIETYKNRVATFETKITVERKPASLSESRMARARWFDHVADHVTECFDVTVTFESGTSKWTETFFEIVTPSGRGCILRFNGAAEELYAFVTNEGKGMIFGCWKKYGRYRGHAVGYLRAHGLKAESKKVDHTCIGAMYAAASGKPWGTR